MFEMINAQQARDLMKQAENFTEKEKFLVKLDEAIRDMAIRNNSYQEFHWFEVPDPKIFPNYVEYLKELGYVVHYYKDINEFTIYFDEDAKYIG